MKTLFRTKSQSHDIDSKNQLRRCLTAFDLTMLGIGAIIGAGIFVLTGIAAATQAGPAIILSYVVAALACGFAALSYAELASSFGGCGGAYGYAYASMGELLAWLIGWDLLLEYGMDAATVSIGWAGYLHNFLHALGVDIPPSLMTDPFHGGIVNLPAMLVIFGLGAILSLGAKSGARFNSVIVYIKMFAIALFVGIGIFYFNPQNWHPFLPFGAQGIINGASFIFFAYIGFDAIATAGEESVNPQRDLPIGIIASLLICTVVYVIVAAVLTGISYYPTLNNSSPVAAVLYKLGYHFSGQMIAIGAIAGLTSTIFAMYFGSTRVFLAMARDGLLPQRFIKLHPKSQTPRRLIWMLAFIMAFTAGLVPIKEVANLVNMGTLAAFVAVCGSVLVLRITKPHLHRPFKTPFSPFVPLAGIVLCSYLMISLPLSTWACFGIWTAGGLLVYLGYSRLNSTLAKPSEATQ